jgi:hypothetical protein
LAHNKKILRRVVTDENFKNETLPMINLDGLKHRERDMIVEILKFWMESNMTLKEMETIW